MQKLRFLSQLLVLVLLARLVLGLGGGDFEKWCPFGGVETLYLFFWEGTFSCSLGSSNLYVLAGVLLLTLLARRSFCGWVCPIGALGEWAGLARERLLPGRRPTLPRALDAGLRLLKYPLLAFILVETFTERELIFRAFDPFYALCSKHGEDITNWAYVALGGVLAGAFFLAQPFCRYLCPLAAVLNPFSRFGLLRIGRDEARCIHCGRCDRACDQAIPVSEMLAVTQARCTQCQECVAACPVPGTLFLTLPGGAGPDARGQSPGRPGSEEVS